ncbi:MAG: hypothetical protein SGI92_17635 [Bryobacteraceae bacterium]|nr:hypothetical protein [Bryobacteraceae bacterium]
MTRLLGLQPGEDVLVRDYSPRISRGDAQFDRLDKPPLVTETAGEHLGSHLLWGTAGTGSDAGELVFEFRGEPDFHIASVTRADGTGLQTWMTRALRTAATCADGRICASIARRDTDRKLTSQYKSGSTE